MGIFDKFKIGFKKSASALTSGIKEIIIKKEIDDKALNEIEDFLIQSDVGVACLLYTSPSPRDAHESRMPSSA